MNPGPPPAIHEQHRGAFGAGWDRAQNDVFSFNDAPTAGPLLTAFALGWISGQGDPTILAAWAVAADSMERHGAPEDLVSDDPPEDPLGDQARARWVLLACRSCARSPMNDPAKRLEFWRAASRQAQHANFRGGAAFDPHAAVSLIEGCFEPSSAPWSAWAEALNEACALDGVSREGCSRERPGL